MSVSLDPRIKTFVRQVSQPPRIRDSDKRVHAHLPVRLPCISEEMLAISACTHLHCTERASIFEPSLARTCVAMSPEGATAQPDSSCACAPGLFQFWYVKAIVIHVSRLTECIKVTAYTVATKLSSFSEIAKRQRLRHRKEDKYPHSERCRRHWIRHADCDARCDRAWTNPSWVNQYSDPTLACVFCMNSSGSSLACKCSHLAVCKDSLNGMSQLEFSLKKGSHTPGTICTSR